MAREQISRKHVHTFTAILPLILLLSAHGVVDVYGQASPVTCVVLTNPVEFELASEYAVTVNPQLATIIPGSKTTFDIVVLSTNGTDFISVDIVGLPEGINAFCNPIKGATEFTSQLTVSLDEPISPGIYTPRVIAQNTNQQLANFKLEVAAAPYLPDAMENEIAESSSKMENEIAESSSKMENEVAELSSKMENEIAELSSKMENEIAELSSRSDELEITIRENQADSFEGFDVVLLLAAIIGSFALGAFALYVLLRHEVKSSTISKGDELKLQNIVELLRQSIEISRKQTEAEPQIKGGLEQIARKDHPAAEPKVGDVWYAYCPKCNLRTEHGRDYEGIFCARCGNRSS